MASAKAHVVLLLLVNRVLLTAILSVAVAGLILSASWTQPRNIAVQPVAENLLMAATSSSMLKNSLSTSTTLAKKIKPVVNDTVVKSTRIDEKHSEETVEETHVVPHVPLPTKKSKQQYSGSTKDVTTNFEGEYDPLKPNDYDEWKKYRGQAKMQDVYLVSIDKDRQQSQHITDTYSKTKNQQSQSHRRGRQLRRRQSNSRSRSRSFSTSSKSRSSLSISLESKNRDRIRSRTPSSDSERDDTDGESMAPMDLTLLPPLIHAIVMREIDVKGMTLDELRVHIASPITSITHQKKRKSTHYQKQSQVLSEALNTISPSTGSLTMPLLSCVVLLTNMAGPDEVDDSLCAETAEECSKHGAVTLCVIHLMQNKPVSETVRIFVQFEALTGAQRAVADLNGRFFAGRKVSARHYDQNLFTQRDFTA